MTRVLIAINPTFYNKGDAAILYGAFETLKRMDNVEISLISYHPEYDSTRCDKTINIISGVNNQLRKDSKVIKALKSLFPTYHLDLLPRSLFKILFYKVFASKIMGLKKEAAYLNSDVIIAGLDGVFSTFYGIGDFILNCHTIILAKIFRKPVVIYAASIEPFKNKIWEFLGRFILNKVDLITLREGRSCKYLQKIGVNGPPMYITGDLAFLLQPASLERVREIMSVEGIRGDSRPLIGMTVSRGVSRWVYPHLEDPGERYRKYVYMMAETVDYLVENLSATVIFIPHSIGPGKDSDDRVVGKDIYKRVRNKHKVKLITNDYTASELKGIIDQCDLLVGARIHSVISAVSLCVPFILIADSVHKPGIVKERLNLENWVLEGFLDISTLISKINELWSVKEKMRKELERKAEKAKEFALLNGKLVKELVHRLKFSS